MIISEIGNQHFGNFKHAKELILASHEAGADLIKGQAFRARDITSGSMPKEFYHLCEFSLEQYIELIDYARHIGNDLFYSIFSKDLLPLRDYQVWHKLAGGQVRQGKFKINEYDVDTALVSVAKDVYPPEFSKANILYVSDYLAKDPELKNIDVLREFYGRDVGYSDHTIGIKACIDAILFHKANIIEKHFTIKKDFKFNGQLYRDCIHGSSPREFYNLVLEYDMVCQGGLH